MLESYSVNNDHSETAYLYYSYSVFFTVSYLIFYHPSSFIIYENGNTNSLQFTRMYYYMIDISLESLTYISISGLECIPAETCSVLTVATAWMKISKLILLYCIQLIRNVLDYMCITLSLPYTNVFKHVVYVYNEVLYKAFYVIKAVLGSCPYINTSVAIAVSTMFMLPTALHPNLFLTNWPTRFVFHICLLKYFPASLFFICF